MNWFFLFFRKDFACLFGFCKCWLDPLNWHYISLSFLYGLTCLGSPCRLYSLWALCFSLSNYHTLGCFISFGERGRVITFCFESELKMGFCQCYCCCISEFNSSDALSPCTLVGLEDRPVGAVVNRRWEGEWAVVCNWRWSWLHDGGKECIVAL